MATRRALRKAKIEDAGQSRKAVGDSRSLAANAYESLKEKIIVGYFLPGQYLNEAAICHQLGYGRTPIHQALQRLHHEGLVEIVPRKGIIIQPETAGLIIEILDARIIVETELARAAAKRATKESVNELERVLLDHASPVAGSAIDEFVDRDRAFHAKIASMSGSKVLSDFARTLHERSIRFWLLTMWQTLDTVASNRQHRAILNAIRRHDPSAASKAMRAHLLSLRSRLTEVQRLSRRRA